MPCQIYFIGPKSPEDVVKIGITEDPKARLVGLQVGNARKLFLLASCPGDRSTERDLHSKFRVDHIQGEWFNVSNELKRLIAHVQRRGRLEGFATLIDQSALAREVGVTLRVINLFLREGMPHIGNPPAFDLEECLDWLQTHYATNASRLHFSEI